MRFARACIVAFVVMVASPRDANAQGDNAALAQQRYVAGLGQFRAAHFDEALGEFRAAMSLYGSPNSRLYVARTLVSLGRLPEAALEYELTASEASDRAALDARYTPTHDAAVNELAEIAPRLAHVIVHLASPPAGARVTLAGRPVPLAALGIALPVLPGHNVLRVEADGFTPAERAVDIAVGESATVEIALEPVVASAAPAASISPPAVAPSRGPTRVWSLAGLAVGMVGAAVAVVFGVLAQNDYARLMTACPDASSCTGQNGLISEGTTYQSVTNAGIWVGGIGLVAGALLYLLLPASREQSRTGVSVRGGVLTVAF